MTPAEPRMRAALSYDVRKSDRLARMPPIIATYRIVPPRSPSKHAKNSDSRALATPLPPYIGHACELSMTVITG